MLTLKADGEFEGMEHFGRFSRFKGHRNVFVSFQLCLSRMPEKLARGAQANEINECLLSFSHSPASYISIAW